MVTATGPGDTVGTTLTWRLLKVCPLYKEFEFLEDELRHPNLQRRRLRCGFPPLLQRRFLRPQSKMRGFASIAAIQQEELEQSRLGEARRARPAEANARILEEKA